MLIQGRDYIHESKIKYNQNNALISDQVLNDARKMSIVTETKKTIGTDLKSQN